MGLSNMLLTTTDTLVLPILNLVSMCSTWSPGCKGCIPASCISPTLVGHTTMSAVSPIRSFTLHSIIWVWSGPNLTCSLTRMGSPIPCQWTLQTGFGPPLCLPLPPHQDRRFHAYSASSKLRPWPMGQTTCQFHSLLLC